MDLIIESYKDSEVALSADLASKAFSYEGKPIAMNFNPDFFRLLWKIPEIERDLLLCAKIKGQIVGQCFTLPRTVKFKGRIFKVGAVAVVAVHPDFRRKGIASSIMEKSIEVAKEKGFDALTLFTGPPSPAQPLYERLGFKVFNVALAKMKILDPWFLSKAVGRSYLGPFMWLKSRVREVNLSEGFALRSYEKSDRSSCVSLAKDYVEHFEYVEPVSNDSWVWWHETMSKTLNPMTFVLEKNQELIGTISFFTLDAKMKSKSKEIEFRIGALADFFYKQGYEQQVSCLMGEALNELKHLGCPMATNAFSPTIFQPTNFLRIVWQKFGFVRLPNNETRYMYKSFNSEFEGLEAQKTFYIQPF